ncbi:MAG: hypothetical protein ACRCZS_06575 [Chroococcidiopsis sp.]
MTQITTISHKDSNKLLLNEHPLIVLPALAKKLGSQNAAIALQQIHYWSQKQCGKIIDGVRWIYNTYEQWQQQLPFLSISTIRRAIALLKKLNLIEVEQHDKKRWNHRNHYRIDYEALKALQLSICSKWTDGNAQFGQMGMLNLDTSSTNSEITSDNTTETATAVATEEKEISITDEQLNECCTQISAVSRDVQLNLMVRSAIASYWVNFPAALQHLKKAVSERWKVNNLTGVFIKALKEGVAKEDVQPISIGWGDWANKAISRKLMLYSTSHGADIMVHLTNGKSRLWSELKSISWEELTFEITNT